MSIADNVHTVYSNCHEDRTRFVFKSLIDHLHAFMRETAVTREEWMSAIQFLTETGQACSDIRQEFILLSDVLGVSAVVDEVNNVWPSGATESTILGPFYTDDARDVHPGDSIASEGKGDYLFVEGRVLDLKGNPISGAIIDAWQADRTGQYDTQYEDRTEPDCRGRLRAAEDGSYSFRAVVPVCYAIPTDGPVGRLLWKLGKHPCRPAHLHFRIEAPGYETLTTALYWKDDVYITSDAVFGVRPSLIIARVVVPVSPARAESGQETETITDTDLTISRGFKDAKPHAHLKYDFVLVKPEECERVKKPSTAAPVGTGV